MEYLFTIQSNQAIAENTMKLVLEGEAGLILSAGQFVNVKLEGFFLRRPISLCDVESADGKTIITLVYKMVGEGTKKLSQMTIGSVLNLLVGLGNGYDTSKSGQHPLLIGGGVGIPPLYHLCKTLIREHKQPLVILGFNSRGDIFFEDEFKALGVNVIVTTMDGSYGIKGFAQDACTDLSYTFFYACGPLKMLEGLCRFLPTSGQLSLEERMGCGFGACMGCAVQTTKGVKRVCKEGPVFNKEELVW